ncbi:hypothetical protein dsx2_1968 [Desulfovibrio sp. X2]|uniref:hypothetical protein n=1 Tax=Desulfovibrio sp. X2 TaxID=941449 RepID=UPI000358A402|nr:hypothetical protein [Desulfovibrio sp. X2]EPR44040.1 hypothetical protein dsx2_1968 [Desulfovibrio sp. X2]
MRVGSSIDSYLQQQNAFSADALSRAAGRTTARVTTRDIGFSLGSFGLRYTSEDVSFDTPENSGTDTSLKAAQQAGAFRDELDVAQQLAQLGAQAPDRTATGQNAAASALAYPQALSAYSRTAQLAEYEPLPGRLLAVA